MELWAEKPGVLWELIAGKFRHLKCLGQRKRSSLTKKGDKDAFFYDYQAGISSFASNSFLQGKIPLRAYSLGYEPERSWGNAL